MNDDDADDDDFVAQCHRTHAFACTIAARAAIIAFACIATLSRYWMRDDDGGKVPGIVNVGLFLGPCYWTDDDNDDDDGASLERWAREVKRSFDGFRARDDGYARCDRSVRAFYACAFDARDGSDSNSKTDVAARALRAAQACAIAFLWLACVELACAVYYYAARARKRRRRRGRRRRRDDDDDDDGDADGEALSSASQIAYGGFALAFATITLAIVASAIRRVVDGALRRVATNDDDDRVALRDVLGWGYWMFLACACAHAAALATTTVEFRAGARDRAARRRRLRLRLRLRRRRVEDEDVEDDAPSAPAMMATTRAR